MPSRPMYEGGQLLTPAEQQSLGIGPPPTGPLSAGVTSGEIRATPTFGQKFLKNLKTEAPGLVGTAASMAIPGSLGTRAILGPLARIAAGMLGSGVTAAATGQPVKDAMSGYGITQTLAEGAFGAGRLALNKTLYRKFAQQQAQRLVTLLTAKVPPMKDLPGSPETRLHDFVYGPGREAVHEMYDQSLTNIIRSATGKELVLSADSAKKLGVKSMTGKSLGQAGAKVQGRAIDVPKEVLTGESVVVDAAETARAMTGKWSKSPQAYREAADALDTAGLGDPKVRAAYKWWSGFSEFADKTKLLENKTYHPERATKGLEQLKALKLLERRGLLSELRPELQNPVTARPVSAWEKFRMGAAGGGLLGGALGGGMPHSLLTGSGGAAAGAALAEAVGPNAIYQGVPLGPLARQAFTKAPPLAGEAVRMIPLLRSTE